MSLTNIRKPDAPSTKDPSQLQTVLQGFYDALKELQGSATTVVQSLAGLPAALMSAGDVFAQQVLFGGTDGKFAQSTGLLYIDALKALVVSGVNDAFLTIRTSATPGVTPNTPRLIFGARNNTFSGNILNRWTGTVNSLEIFLSGGEVDNVFSFAGAKFALNIFGTTGDTVLGTRLTLAPTSIDGFMYIPAVSAPPTGVPRRYGGATAGTAIPFCIEIPAMQLWAYNGAWVAV